MVFALRIEDRVEDIDGLVGRVHSRHRIRCVPRGKSEGRRPEARGRASPRPIDRAHIDAADARHERQDQAPEQCDKHGLHARGRASARHRAERTLEEVSAGWYAAGGCTRHVGTDVHLWTRLSGISKARAPAHVRSFRKRACACMCI